MKRRVETWTIEKLQKQRPRISFPEYQRQPNLWPLDKKQRLIDSILTDIDIPKIYLNETEKGTLEVVDGTQRLWSIWEFLDDEFPVTVDDRFFLFTELPKARRDFVKAYTLQFTVLDNAADHYLRELFIRLQLGLLLVTGEKLNADTGLMKDWVFRTLAKHPFIQGLRIPERRRARETLAAQLAINSFSKALRDVFARTRYEDLHFFFLEYSDPTGDELAFFKKQSKTIVQTLDALHACLGAKSAELTNRSYILSVYLLFEALRPSLLNARDQRAFADFVHSLLARTKQESREGFFRKNKELYAFDTMLSSAPGERYQIDRRHSKMLEFYGYFLDKKKIKGD